MSEIKTLKPNLKWFQTKENISVEIDHRDIKGQSIQIENDKITIKFSLNGTQYEDSLDLFENIKSEESKEIDTGYQIKILLIKNTPQFWKYLTKNDKTRKNIKVDWNNFNDSEEEKEEPQNPMGNFDMSSMMGNPDM